MLPGLRWRSIRGNAEQCKETKQLFHLTCRAILTVQKPHKGNKSSSASVTYADANSAVHGTLFADMTSSSNPHIKPVRQVAEGILNSPCLWWKPLPNIRTAYHSLHQHPKCPCHQYEQSSGQLWLVLEKSTKRQNGTAREDTVVGVGVGTFIFYETVALT